MSGMKRERSMVMLPSVAKRERQVSGGDNARVGPSSSPAAAGAIGTAAGSATWPRRVDAGDLPGLKTAAFLAACALCGKGLGPGKDTYIYRGELAFCSPECRELHIKREEHIRQQQGGSTTTSPAPAAQGTPALSPYSS